MQFNRVPLRGPVQTIKRNAEKGGALTAIDDITMEYETGSNRLKRVTDVQSANGIDQSLTIVPLISEAVAPPAR